jgi:hypothetical protein
MTQTGTRRFRFTTFSNLAFFGPGLLLAISQPPDGCVSTLLLKTG